MTTSPSLQIEHIATNQKSLTANTAFDVLDKASNADLTIDFGSGDVTLTDAQFNEAGIWIFQNTSSPPAAQALTIPARSRVAFVVNDSGATITIGTGDSPAETAAIADGERKMIATDGSDVWVTS